MDSNDGLDFSELEKIGERIINVGLELENKPMAVKQLLDSEALLAISHIGIPKQYHPYRFSLGNQPVHEFGHKQKLMLIEYLSRFDASVLLAMPGTSLSTKAVLSIGSEEQIRYFFSFYKNKPTWTFFAVTEPTVGSDLTSVKSRIYSNDGGLFVNASKYFIGGAQRAGMGLVFVLNKQQPQLVIINTEKYPDKINIAPLDSYGLVGTGLSTINIQSYKITGSDILGRSGESVFQAFAAINAVFEYHRPMVAAMALGTARGILDLLKHNGVNGLKYLLREYNALYEQLMNVGENYDRAQIKTHDTSLLKVSATRFVEYVANQLPHMISRQQWLEHPLLSKRYRDAFAFEYMEGTGNIHTLNAFRTYSLSRNMHG